MTSKRMLLFPPGGPWRPAFPTQAQAPATNRATLANVFGAPTTPGHLLLYLMTQRQAAAHPPTDGETWTTLATGQFQRTTTADENGIGAYACICTIAQASHATASLTNSVMYEIAGSSLVGITTLLVSDHAAGTAVDLGSFGVLDTGRLGFGLFGFGPDFVTTTVSPGVWTRDFYSGRDIAVASNVLNDAFPYSYYAHVTGAGAAVQARVDIDSAQKYGGIAVLLA